MSIYVFLSEIYTCVFPYSILIISHVENEFPHWTKYTLTTFPETTLNKPVAFRDSVGKIFGNNSCF